MNGEAWLVTRYDDVSPLLKDPRLTKDASKAAGPDRVAGRLQPPAMFAPMTRNMLAMDDPDYARLKRLVQAAFTTRRMNAMADTTRAAANALIDGLERQPRFDLIASFALPLPVGVISGLLGIPPRDRDRFARWSRALIRAARSRLSIVLALPEVAAFLRYLKRLIATKRADPQDDLVSALVQAEDGDRLDGDELMAMIAILLSAGHETTTNLIGNAMVALLEAPDAREALRANPAMMDVGRGAAALRRPGGDVDTPLHAGVDRDRRHANPARRPGAGCHRVGEPGFRALRGGGPAGFWARREPAPDLRRGWSLLRGRRPGAAGRADRDRGAAGPAPRHADRRPRVAAALALRPRAAGIGAAAYGQ